MEQEIKSVLLVLRGPAATGKTTYRDKLIALQPNYTYVNKDEIRMTLLENLDLKPKQRERKVHEIQMELMEQYAKKRLSIIIDNTNINKKTLDSYRSWADKHGYEYQVKSSFAFDVSWQEAIRRDELRDKSVGRSVIMQMYIDLGAFRDVDRDVVIFDIDGTVADLSHRRHYVQVPDGQKKDWKSFYATLEHDTPIEHIHELYKVFKPHYDIIFVSGRPSDYRAKTEAWLIQHGFDGYHMLLMRSFNDSRDDTIIKRELYQKYIKPFYDVKFVVDDRPKVVREWRSLGLTTLQVGDGMEF